MSLLKRFSKKEDGVITIEFLLMFPLYFFLMLAGIENGFVMLRHALLEQSVTNTVRDIQLSPVNPPNYQEVKELICDGHGLIKDCTTDLKVEMFSLDFNSNVSIPTGASCIDKPEEIDLPDKFATGTENQLMFMRVCAGFDPFIKGPGLLSLMLPKNGKGQFNLVTVAAFSIEPQ